jgi:hypothetical protein
MRPSTAGCILCAALLAPVLPGLAQADGKVFKPRNYEGSLEEKAQEAIIIFQGSKTPGEATEDLILKIGVRGRADRFAWVIPFPNQPKVEKEDAALFRELHDYVESRLAARREFKSKDKAAGKKGEDVKPVEVLAREIVGSYDVAVVREKEAGALNRWLKAEQFQPLPEDAEDVIGFYRRKGYVFACIKVAETGLSQKQQADLHPLRFTFKTGGRDGIYFPVKLTGLQEDPFDVNLYVFFRFWLNDRLSKYGYVHRGFHLRYRDWDTKDCTPNGGKAWSSPGNDPFLRGYEFRLLTVAKLLKKLHSDERYYLTNIQAFGLKPAEVRKWPEDLWLFPYYTDRERVPYDAQAGGPAEADWPDVPGERDRRLLWGGLGLAAAAVAVVGVVWWRRRRMVAQPGT